MGVWKTAEDLTGREFGRLTVISRAGSRNGHAMWNCRCSCKDEKIITVRAGSLKSGNTKSCGCLVKEGTHTTHGKRHDRIYNTWEGIKQRCTNLNSPAYKHYGGRGVKMFAAWIDDFDAFYNYVSQLEHFDEEGYTLDRINVNGNYEPDNLRFATQKEQCRNKRTNVLVEYNGEQMTLAEAAELSRINYQTLCSRYRAGKRGDELFAPVK